MDHRKLDLRSELHVVRVVLENPSMYVGELHFEVMHVWFGKVSPLASTVCRTLRIASPNK